MRIIQVTQMLVELAPGVRGQASWDGEKLVVTGITSDQLFGMVSKPAVQQELPLSPAAVNTASVVYVDDPLPAATTIRVPPPKQAPVHVIVHDTAPAPVTPAPAARGASKGAKAKASPPQQQAARVEPPIAPQPEVKAPPPEPVVLTATDVPAPEVPPGVWNPAVDFAEPMEFGDAKSPLEAMRKLVERGLTTVQQLVDEVLRLKKDSKMFEKLSDDVIESFAIAVSPDEHSALTYKTSGYTAAPPPNGRPTPVVTEDGAEFGYA